MYLNKCQGIFLIAIFSGFLFVGCGRQKEPPPASPIVLTRILLECLTHFIADEIFYYQYNGIFAMKKTFDLPDGNVNDIENWLYQREKEYKKIDKNYYSFFFLGRLGQIEHFMHRKPSGEFDLKDLWNQKLIYECPAKDPSYVFRLYSIGENGIDEKGSGDDIECSLKYSEIKVYFEDPKFDGNAYRKFRGQLTKSKTSFKIHHP